MAATALDFLSLVTETKFGDVNTAFSLGDELQQRPFEVVGIVVTDGL
jgi:hypothetical protein